MPRSFFERRRRFFPQKPRGSERASGRGDLPPDPVLEVSSLALDIPFAFGADWAERLRRRDVNVKEAFTVRDGAGVFYRASLKELRADGGTAVPYERMEVSPEPTIELTLACAVLARQRMLFVAQKATELGASRIVPLLTEHSVPRSGLEHEKAHAWPGQVLRAAKQCRRGSLPELAPAMPFDAFLSSPLADADLSLCLDNVGGHAAPSGRKPRRVLLWVGPEGGFSEAERQRLEGRTHFWSLGGRVLRAETAVVTGLALIQFAWGGLGTAR